MKKKYLYNGNILTEDDIADGAKQSNLDIPTYLQKAGIKELSNTYNYNGKFLSPEDVLDGANQSKLNFDDYIQKAGILPADESSKKKESLASVGSQFFGNGSVVGAAGMSQLNSNHPLLSEDVNKKLNQSAKELGYDIDKNDIVKSFLNPFYNNQQKAILNQQVPVSESTGQQFLSPIQQQQQNINSQQLPSVEKASRNLSLAKDLVSQTLFPSGKDAKDYLTKKIMSGGTIDPNNETDALAKQKNNEYDNIYNNLRSSGNIEDAAINDKVKNDLWFSGQVDALKKEGLDIDRATKGQAVAEYLYKNMNNLQDLAKEHPDIKNNLDYLQKNFYDMFPETGQAIVANKISQAREKLGYNSSVANFSEVPFLKIPTSFKKHNDQIASTLSPEEQKVYNEHKDAINGMIDTGGFLNRFEEGIEGGWSSTKNLFNRITGLNSKGERISDEMTKQAMAVTNGETGWKKALGTAGNFAGTIAYMAAGGRVGEGLGMSPTVAEHTMNGLTFGEGMMRNGEMKYPDNPFKATLDGIVNTVAFSALSPLKAGKLNEVFGKISPEINDAIKDLPANATVNEAKKTLMGAIQNGLKNYGTSVAEMGVILPSISQGLDMAMGLDKKTFDKYHAGEFERSIRDIAIGGLLPNVLRTVSEIKKANGNEANTSNEDLNKNIPTTEEGTGEPPKQPSDELPFGKQPTTGIAHDIREGRTYDTKSDKPLRGEGVTVEESIQHGNDLLKSGKDPQQVADKFLQDPEKNISYNGISLVRAQNRVNVKATDDAQEKFGENSNEYKEALDKENKWYNEVVKPMQTEWSKIGQAQQGETDIDTGTFTGLRRTKIQNTGKELSPKEVKEAKELAGKVKVLTKQVEDLKQKLTDTLDKNEKTDEPKLTFTEKAKKIADQFRKLKQKPFTFKDENGNDIPLKQMGIGWNDLVELGAKAIEQTGKIADGIKAIVEKIKDEDWYKKLSDSDKNRLEKDLSEYYSEKEDLVTRFADKKDNKFSPEDAKDIWQYARDNYLDKGQTFTDTIQKTAMDLGLKPQQVIDAISQPKGAKNITNEMYRVNYERNRAIQKAKQWATKSDSTAVDKFFNIISSPFRSLATLGHGHALLFTHAATNLFDYRVTKKFLSLAARQFKIVYGKQKYYDQTVSALKNDPLYNTELRSGLAINPDTVYDDWQLANNFLKKLKIQGNKGFLILKMFRHELFKYEYNKLSDIEKADPQALKNLAQVVNHWTGTAGIKPSATGNAFIFAPNLIVSKWARLTTDPLKALVTLGNWKNASTEDKVASKIILRKSGRIAATYIAALAGNQALLSLSGSNQNINFTNPFKSDWLKFKTGGKTIDLSGGMQNVGQLLIGMGALPFKSGKDVANDYYGAKTADDVVKNEVSGYLRRTMSPFGGTVWDVLSHKDFEGNVLPFYSDKPRSGKKRLSYGQYIMEKMPIPIAEGYRDFHNQLVQDGVDKSLADKITGAFIVAGAGSAGIKIGNEPKERPSPFTEQQTKDPRVSWIYNEWKKELPNTVPTSEEITKEDEAFKDKLSTLPKEVQDNYQKQHTENLFDILGNIHDNGTVFVKHYHDSNGNPVSQVYLSAPKGDYDEKSLKKLTDSEQAQVLHLAQAEATSKTKKEMFNQ